MRGVPLLLLGLGGALAPAALTVPSTLAGQSRASKLVDAAFASLGNHNLDSAETLLRPVLDSTVKATTSERAAALVLHGVIDFYRAQDSAAASDFRAALTLSLALKGEWLTRVDSQLGAIWRRERNRLLCGLPWRDSLRIALGEDSTVLTEKPSVLKGPWLEYPPDLRRAGLMGRVRLTAVIDTSGRAELASIKIIDSPHEDFSRVARHYVANAVYRPARIGGQPVRACIEIPVDFKITVR